MKKKYAKKYSTNYFVSPPNPKKVIQKKKQLLCKKVLVPQNVISLVEEKNNQARVWRQHKSSKSA